MLTSHIWRHSNLNVFRNRCPTLRMQMIACTTKIKEWTYATFGVHQRILTKSTKSTKVNAKMKLVLPWRIKRSTRTMKTKQFTQARCWSYRSLDEIDQTEESTCKNETGFSLKDNENHQENENKAVHTSQVLSLPESWRNQPNER